VKRIVFVHPSGLHQIMGTDGDLPAPALPVTAGPFEALGRRVEFASLYRMTSRGAFYREPIVPAEHTFHEAQR